MLRLLDSASIFQSSAKIRLRYSRGAFIIPLSLCAGLEFDAVIVWNAADEQYAPDSEEDKRKLYVASTRAMHQLIFHKYPKTPSKLVDALVGRQLVVPASL
jgi:DNA helicase IV